MLSWIQGAAVLRHGTSDVSHIVYVTGALLEKAKLSGILAFFFIMTINQHSMFLIQFYYN